MVSTDNGEQNGGSDESNGAIIKGRVPLHISPARRELIISDNPQNRSDGSSTAIANSMRFLNFGSLESPSTKFQRIVVGRDEISRNVPSSSSHAFRERLSRVFSRKIDWTSLKKICKEWIRNPMNMVLLVWIICVAVSGAILFLVMTGMLNSALPKKSQRNAWFEVNNQILNALFTLMCLYQHPQRLYHLVLLLRWRPQDISRLRKIYCKNGTYKPHEWAHMMVVISLLNLNCFAQYALCGLNVGYKRSERPAIGVGISISVAIGAPAIAGVYSIVSPLGKDYHSELDEEAQQLQSTSSDSSRPSQLRSKSLQKRFSFASRDEERIVENRPQWSGGVLDFWDDISLAYLSLFCSFCVFGWNMERFGFGNMYVHIATFLLFCMAPFWIFNLAAININNEIVRETLGLTGVFLCLFGLLYGGFWRIQMRKRFNLPPYNCCGGKPAVADCALWLFCCWCTLAQEVRTGNFYDIVEDKLCRKLVDESTQLPISPLPREDGDFPIRSAPTSPMGDISSPAQIIKSNSPSPSRFSNDYRSPGRQLPMVEEEPDTKGKDEWGRKRSKGSLKNKEYKTDEYLEYRLYWCSFGPENYGEGGDILPSRRYRLNTRNRAARPQSMRGCTCHFIVKRLYARPSLAVIIYNDRRHVNKSGFVCHGPLDRDAIGPGAKKIPYICNEIQQQTMSMIYLGIPEENVLEKHIEGIQRYCGSNAKVDSLASQYVHKLGMIIRRSTHELDLDDKASIRLWVERNKKSILFYQDTSETDPFILGIQTEWQLQQMIRFGHRSLIAADSTFGIKKLKYPLCTILVFDSRQHALPVAWIITRSIAKLDVSKWMKALLDRAIAVDPGWKVNGFLIDDAAAEIDPIRETFSCPVLFSLWRVRRSWLRNIVKKCSNIEVQRELFKRLGEMVYSIWGGVDSFVALEKLTQDFIDQTNFVQYFKAAWVPKIEMWLTTIRRLPLASQEASGAIEAYHVKLKVKLYDDSHLGALKRVDWLVHKLTTELHSSYWLDRYADESDSFQSVKEEYIANTSWHRALQIPDTAVTLDDKDHLFAKVLSQKDSSSTHLVWNPGSEFAFCDCEWSTQGNLCKHIIKVNMVCENQQGYQNSMSFQSFRGMLTDLLKKPTDDSISMDLSMAWTQQMLDQIQKLVELNIAKDIGSVVNNLPLRWVSKKGRTSIGKPQSTLALPSNTRTATAPKKNQKRKRLSRLR